MPPRRRFFFSGRVPRRIEYREFVGPSGLLNAKEKILIYTTELIEEVYKVFYKNTTWSLGFLKEGRGCKAEGNELDFSIGSHKGYL